LHWNDCSLQFISLSGVPKYDAAKSKTIFEENMLATTQLPLELKFNALDRLRQNFQLSFRRAGFARGICFFLRIEEKQIPRFARDDNKRTSSAVGEAHGRFGRRLICIPHHL
jgi:hypothetical protein